MVRLNPIQSNFSSGQASKNIKGRVDSQGYYNAVEIMKNIVPMPQGGATRRPASQYVADGQTNQRLIEFWISSTESLLLLFYSGNIGVYANDSLVHTITTTGITGTPLADFDFTQSRDVLFLTHNTFIKKLIRTNNTTWSLVDYDYQDGPFFEINLDREKKLHPSATTGTIDIVAKNKAGTNLPTFWTTADVNRLVRFRHRQNPDMATGPYWGCAKITGLKTGPTTDHTVTADVQEDFELGNTAGIKNWRLGAWSDGDGYPDVIMIDGSRVYNGKDNKIWGTKAGDFETYSPTVEDDDEFHIVTDDSGLDITMLDLRATRIQWIWKDQAIHIGTDNGRYTLTGGANGITPSSAALKFQSGQGCSRIKPVNLDTMFFVPDNRQKLFKTEFNFRTDRYEDIDLNQFASDILEKQIKRIAVITYPWDMIWCLLDDGNLACLTYDKENNIVAWSQHEIAGATVNDIAVLKNSQGEDMLYLGTTRDGNNYIEKLSDFVEHLKTTTKSDYILLDGAYVDASASSQTSQSGLARFNGETVYVMSNGTIYHSGTVSSGSISWTTPITGDIQIGMNPDVQIRTLPIDVFNANTSTFGFKKTVAKVGLGLINSLNVNVKQIGSNQPAIPYLFRDLADGEASPDLFSGYKENSPPSKSANEVFFDITQSLPAPLTIAYIVYRVEVEQ